jgi:hypothetical protein
LHDSKLLNLNAQSLRTGMVGDGKWKAGFPGAAPCDEAQVTRQTLLDCIVVLHAAKQINEQVAVA